MIETKEKKCPDCGVTKSSSDFYKRCNKCKSCQRKYQRERYHNYTPEQLEQDRARHRKHYKEHKVRYSEIERKWRLANPERCREKTIKYRYGISSQEFADLLALQRGMCAICKEVLDRPHIDHDHTTGKIRGLLCSKCNRVLGFLNDDPDLLWAAIEYLTALPDRKVI